MKRTWFVEYASLHDYEVSDCRDGAVEITVTIDFNGTESYVVQREKALTAAAKLLATKVDYPEDWNWVGIRQITI